MNVQRVIKRLIYSFLGKFAIIKNMGIRLGNFDPLQLIFNIMNALMRKGAISYDEAREILKGALPPEMSEAEKDKILDSMVKKNVNSPKS